MNQSGPERDRHDIPPAAERELEETIFEAGLDASELDASEKGRRLFVHGLLREEAELQRSDALERRQARIDGILGRLDRPASSLEDLERAHPLAAPQHPSHGPAPVSIWRSSRFRLIVSSAAAVLLALVSLFWLVGNRSLALPELLAMARENTSRGLHIYRGYVQTPRGKQDFDLALAEGGKAQIHIETKRGNFDFGSTGKMGWFRTPIGKAVEVPLWDLGPLLDALPANVRALSPDLSYLEVEGILSKIMTKEGMSITGHEKDTDGNKLVVIAGKYRVLGHAPRRRGRRAPPSTIRRVYTGSVKIRMSPEKGWIHDIRFKDDRRKADTLLERVLSLPRGKKTEQPDWIDFEPEFTKSVPSLRLMRFFGFILKKVREIRLAPQQIKKAREIETVPEHK